MSEPRILTALPRNVGHRISSDSAWPLRIESRGEPIRAALPMREWLNRPRKAGWVQRPLPRKASPLWNWRKTFGVSIPTVRRALRGDRGAEKQRAGNG